VPSDIELQPSLLEGQAVDPKRETEFPCVRVDFKIVDIRKVGSSDCGDRPIIVPLQEGDDQPHPCATRGVEQFPAGMDLDVVSRRGVEPNSWRIVLKPIRIQILGVDPERERSHSTASQIPPGVQHRRHREPSVIAAISGEEQRLGTRLNMGPGVRRGDDNRHP
jgi:hypothetical protein